MEALPVIERERRCYKCGGEVDGRTGKCFQCGQPYVFVEAEPVSQPPLIKRLMLHYMRQLIISRKGVFEKAIIAYAACLPEPTRENVEDPNSLVLLDMRDEFRTLYFLFGKQRLLEAAWKILIDENEHDPHPRDLFGWFAEELVEAVLDGRWKPRALGLPLHVSQHMGYWRETPPYGLYIGRSFKELIKEGGDRVKK